jgi:hypothetical protein
LVDERTLLCFGQAGDDARRGVGVDLVAMVAVEDVVFLVNQDRISHTIRLDAGLPQRGGFRSAGVSVNTGDYIIVLYGFNPRSGKNLGT